MIFLIYLCSLTWFCLIQKIEVASCSGTNTSTSDEFTHNQHKNSTQIILEIDHNAEILPLSTNPEIITTEIDSFCKDIDRPVTVRCINCICQAATACSPKSVCRGSHCGPFAISKQYWLEVNSPTVNRVNSSDPDAFLNCVNSYYCSYFVIQRYMDKHKKDCNGDGKIDCDDFVALHKLGPDDCDQELPETYQEI